MATSRSIDLAVLSYHYHPSKEYFQVVLINFMIEPIISSEARISLLYVRMRAFPDPSFPSMGKSSTFSLMKGVLITVVLTRG